VSLAECYQDLPDKEASFEVALPFIHWGKPDADPLGKLTKADWEIKLERQRV
jgi:hypothetical protein